MLGGDFVGGEVTRYDPSDRETSSSKKLDLKPGYKSHLKCLDAMACYVGLFQGHPTRI